MAEDVEQRQGKELRMLLLSHFSRFFYGDELSTIMSAMHRFFLMIVLTLRKNNHQMAVYFVIGIHPVNDKDLLVVQAFPLLYRNRKYHSTVIIFSCHSLIYCLIVFLPFCD